MSTRRTLWLSPTIREWGIHLYHEVRDDWIYIDISRGYGFHIRIAPTRRRLRRWTTRKDRT